VSRVERHPHSAQLFMPLTGGRYLVAVCKSDACGAPVPSTFAAFIARRTQGIAYRPGVWHMPIAALDENADFLMFMWESAGAEDCETRALERAVQVVNDKAF